eukprot:scaffold1621_cov350-Prasinococcus_capsulatus_cf.AAC.19
MVSSLPSGNATQADDGIWRVQRRSTTSDRCKEHCCCHAGPSNTATPPHGRCTPWVVLLVEAWIGCEWCPLFAREPAIR